MNSVSTEPMAANADSVLTYLRAMLELKRLHLQNPGRFAYLGMEDFLLQHGKPYMAARLPKRVRAGIPGACFDQAYRLAKRRKWLYVEGVALGSVIPVHHAWCEDPSNPGVAIDPTWATLSHASTEQYFGCAFALPLVASVRAAFSSVLDDWTRGWPLLKGDIPESRWRP